MTRFYAAAAQWFKRRTRTPSSVNTKETKTKTQRDEDVRVRSLVWKDGDESLLVRVPAVQTERDAVSDSSGVTGRKGRPLEDEGAGRVNHMS